MREVLEAIGWEITWVAKERMIIGKEIGSTDRVFKFTINQNKGVFNGKQENLIYAPKLVNGITYLYAGVLQKLSVNVDWDDSNQVLLIEQESWSIRLNLTTENVVVIIKYPELRICYIRSNESSYYIALVVIEEW